VDLDTATRDFFTHDLSTARVHLGSYNFPTPADRKDGENLVIVRDRRIAVSDTCCFSFVLVSRF
jgi:hypothetical protein